MRERFVSRAFRALITLLAALTFAALATASAHAAGQGESIGGRLEERTAEDERIPVEGVRLTVEGDGFSEEAESDSDGEWRIDLPGPGTYTVTLDDESLPDGVTLREGAQNPVTSEVREGRSATVRFNLGEGSRTETSTMDQVVERTAVGLRFGLLLALASVGLSLIFGTTGLTNFAHAEQVTLGGLLGYTFGATLGLPLWVSAILVVACGGAFGWTQDALLWKPLRRRGIGLIPMMIVTIGLSLFARSLLQAFYGTSPRTFPERSEIVELGPIRLSLQDYVSMGIAVLVLLGVGYVLMFTRWGKATRAVSDNPALAAASGIDVDTIIRGVWTIGAALAALGGMLLGLSQQVSTEMGRHLLLLMFAAVVLGGLGTAFGAMVGALVVGIFVEVSTLFVPAEIKNVGALAILVLILLIRPQGILGRRERIG